MRYFEKTILRDLRKVRYLEKNILGDKKCDISRKLYSEIKRKVRYFEKTILGDKKCDISRKLYSDIKRKELNLFITFLEQNILFKNVVTKGGFPLTENFPQSC